MVMIGLALAALTLGLPHMSPQSRPRAKRRGVDVLLVARLLALSVASGRPLGAALEDVRPRVDEFHAPAIDDVLARATRDGLTAALIETTGPLAELAERLARAQVTGAPVGPALDAFITSVHVARRYRAVEEARTVGVKLMVPLTLLLLPGFLALIVAPFVLDQLDGILGAGIP